MFIQLVRHVPNERGYTLEDVLVEEGVARVLRDGAQNVDESLQVTFVARRESRPRGQDHAHCTCEVSQYPL